MREERAQGAQKGRRPVPHRHRGPARHRPRRQQARQRVPLRRRRSRRSWPSQPEGRAAEAERGQAIVEEEAQSFEAWTHEHALTPTIVALRARTRACSARRSIAACTASCGTSDRRSREALAIMIDAATNKLLHGPVARLRRAGGRSGCRGVPGGAQRSVRARHRRRRGSEDARWQRRCDRGDRGERCEIARRQGQRKAERRARPRGRSRRGGAERDRASLAKWWAACHTQYVGPRTECDRSHAAGRPWYGRGCRTNLLTSLSVASIAAATGLFAACGGGLPDAVVAAAGLDAGRIQPTGEGGFVERGGRQPGQPGSHRRCLQRFPSALLRWADQERRDPCRQIRMGAGARAAGAHRRSAA